MKKEKVFPKDFVREAVETTDHILWESIIRVYDNARSVAFQQEENEVRVVYEVKINNSLDITDSVLPPAEYFPFIKKIFTQLSMNWVTINKMPVTSFSIMKKTCSHPNYFEFFLDILDRKIISLGPEKLDHLKFFKWEVVEIYLSDGTCLCCPCSGTHLENLGSLHNWFNVNFARPRRVGENKYEFKFNVTAIA